MDKIQLHNQPKDSHLQSNVDLSNISQYFSGGGHDDIGHFRDYKLPHNASMHFDMNKIIMHFMPQSFVDGMHIRLYLIDGINYNFGQVFKIPFSNLRINFGNR